MLTLSTFFTVQTVTSYFWLDKRTGGIPKGNAQNIYQQFEPLLLSHTYYLQPVRSPFSANHRDSKSVWSPMHVGDPWTDAAIRCLGHSVPRCSSELWPLLSRLHQRQTAFQARRLMCDSRASGSSLCVETAPGICVYDSLVIFAVALKRDQGNCMFVSVQKWLPFLNSSSRKKTKTRYPGCS